VPHVERGTNSHYVRTKPERKRALWTGMVFGYWGLLLAFVDTFEFCLNSNPIVFSAHPDKYFSR
jgi:hypothetical protein